MIIIASAATAREIDNMAEKTLPKVAVIGCGYWGKNLVRNFAEIGALTAICDDNANTAQTIASQCQVAALDLETIVSAAGIDAVAIATPVKTHFDIAKKALLAGKHVFVEKPLALQVEDAETLKSLSEQQARVLMVGHLLQYHPAFLQLKKLAMQGELGRLRHIYSQRLNLGKIRREENILWSFAPHDISMILALVGSEPDQVSASGGFFLHSQIADVTTTHMFFPGGENAQVFVSWLHPYKEQKLVVVGDEVMAVFDDAQEWERKLLLYQHKMRWQDGLPTFDKAEAKPVKLVPAEPLRQELEHFLACIKGETNCRTDGAEALRVLKVLQASEQSLREHRHQDREQQARRQKNAGALAGCFVHETAIVDAHCKIGRGTRVWHFSHVLAHSQIGENCTLGQNVMVGPGVSIGDNCKIQNNVSIYRGVTLEAEVFCGPSAVFTNVSHPRAGIEKKNEFASTVVRQGATIGANATIVCGVEIGAHSMVAAGAVVVKDVKPFALVAGVPAKQIGWVGHYGERLDENLVCPRTGKSYALTADGMLEEAKP